MNHGEKKKSLFCWRKSNDIDVGVGLLQGFCFILNFPREMTNEKI
jgi:hypothetical protein